MSYKGGKFAQRHVPKNLRHILSAESAANDGLAYPFLTLAIYLTLESSHGVAITHWILIGCLCMLSINPQILSFHVSIVDQVVLGVVSGAILGPLNLVSIYFVLTFIRLGVFLPD